MAFKMKGGKDPMKKNFPDLTGDGKVTQADILKGRGVFKMKKDNAPMMRMEKGAMKKMGSPKKIDLKFSGGQDAKKERDATAKKEFLANYKKMTPEEQAKIPKPVKEAYGV